VIGLDVSRASGVAFANHLLIIAPPHPGCMVKFCHQLRQSECRFFTKKREFSKATPFGTPFFSRNLIR
jgi:hypothetical protein